MTFCSLKNYADAEIGTQDLQTKSSLHFAVADSILLVDQIGPTLIARSSMSVMASLTTPCFRDCLLGNAKVC